MDNQTGNPVIFGIVGSGWRSEFYLRIAALMPERFIASGLVTRNAETGADIERRFGIKTYRTVDDMLRHTSPKFTVLSVKRSVAPDLMKELAGKKMPVLSETPPSGDLQGLIELNELCRKGARIQVAEQYPLQPLHAARIALASSGKLGDISHAQVSFSHMYHAISMIRELLGVTFEQAVITGRAFTSEIVEGPGRKGLPEKENMVQVRQDFGMLDFGGKTGIYDFAENQHRSFIRSQRILVRGTRGEISNLEVRYLKDYRTPVEYDLILKHTGLYGNVDDYYIKGVLAGEDWIYTNPYIPGRLSEDEIAVATCLDSMAAYVDGGSEFYSLQDSAQDCYLAMCVSKAIETGEKIVTQKQPWVR